MITCKCGCIYPDEYAGSCGDCGAGMGSQSGQPKQLVWSAPMAAQRQSQMERQIQNRDHSNIKFAEDDPVFNAAREMVLDLRTPEQKAADGA